MPRFEQGDIVRVPFPYVERPIIQHRPALVVSKGPMGADQRLIWVAMITSAENRPWPDDVPVGPDHVTSGLPVPSVVRPCKLATIETMLIEPIGRLPPAAWMTVERVLARYLGLG